jgi:F0F1-type ATP synthase assembly protein I
MQMNQEPGARFGQEEPEKSGHGRSELPPHVVEPEVAGTRIAGMGVTGMGLAGTHAATTLRALGAASRVQTLVATALALGLLLVGPVAAWSSMVGSLAVYLPGVLFTAVVARKIGSDSAGFLRTAALAEFGKLFLTGLLCALAFIWVKPLEPGWFFAGMLAVLATGWIGFARALR